MKLLSDEGFLTDTWGGVKSINEEITSMSQILRLTKTSLIKHDPLGEHIYYTNLDLHTTRTLYLHRNALASYDTLPKSGMHTKIKNISVRAIYNELIVDSSMAGFDYCYVSRRSFQRIDFRRTDYYGKPFKFKNSHWSMSTIFQKIKIYNMLIKFIHSIQTT